MKINQDLFGSLLAYSYLCTRIPLVCKILGSVVKEQLRKINPARVRYTEFKPPQGGFIFNEQTNGEEESYSVC